MGNLRRDPEPRLLWLCIRISHAVFEKMKKIHSEL